MSGDWFALRTLSVRRMTLVAAAPRQWLALVLPPLVGAASD